MIKEYSLKIHGENKLSDNFRVRELACKDGSDIVLVDLALVELLQKIRNHFGEVVINSGYRTNSHNYRVGGSPKSQHLLGKAADIVVKDALPKEVAEYAEYLGAGGIGLYNGFTHIDTRENRARWDSRSGQEIAVEGFGGYKPKGEAPLVSVHNAAGEVSTTLEGVYKGGSIYAPVRALCEALGHEVKYIDGIVYIK